MKTSLMTTMLAISFLAFPAQADHGSHCTNAEDLAILCIGARSTGDPDCQTQPSGSTHDYYYAFVPAGPAFISTSMSHNCREGASSCAWDTVGAAAWHGSEDSGDYSLASAAVTEHTCDGEANCHVRIRATDEASGTDVDDGFAEACLDIF